MDDDDIEQTVLDEQEDEPKRTRRKQNFKPETIRKRKEKANSPENLEKLSKMREKARIVLDAKAKANFRERVKMQAKELGYNIAEPPPPEEPKPIIEPPKQPEPIVEAPKPPPTPAPIVEAPEPTKRRTPKRKPKRQVEYTDGSDEDDEPEEIEYRPPRRPSKQVSQNDIESYFRQKYASMDLSQLDNRIAKQAFDFKYNQYKEEIMGNQIFGRY